MYPADRVAEVLALAATGLNASAVCRMTGVSRATVRDWINGKVPSSVRDAETGCPACGNPAHPFDDLPAEYIYLLGMYLGDGCISTHKRGVYRLRIVLDGRYPGIIDECAAAKQAVMPRNRVGRQKRTGNFVTSSPHSHTEIHAYSKSWPCLFPQHGAGKKHERRIVLTYWQEALVDQHPQSLLRGLIHSDGCRFINTGRNWRHPRYVFNNYSDDIRRIFCQACDRLGLHWTTAPHTVYVSRVADVAALDEYIGPKA